jgi:hypothetical protein
MQSPRSGGGSCTPPPTPAGRAARFQDAVDLFAVQPSPRKARCVAAGSLVRSTLVSRLSGRFILVQPHRRDRRARNAVRRPLERRDQMRHTPLVSPGPVSQRPRLCRAGTRRLRGCPTRLRSRHGCWRPKHQGARRVFILEAGPPVLGLVGGTRSFTGNHPRREVGLASLQSRSGPAAQRAASGVPLAGRPPSASPGWRSSRASAGSTSRAGADWARPVADGWRRAAIFAVHLVLLGVISDPLRMNGSSRNRRCNGAEDRARPPDRTGRVGPRRLSLPGGAASRAGRRDAGVGRLGAGLRRTS